MISATGSTLGRCKSSRIIREHKHEGGYVCFDFVFYRGTALPPFWPDVLFSDRFVCCFGEFQLGRRPGGALLRAAAFASAADTGDDLRCLILHRLLYTQRHAPSPSLHAAHRAMRSPHKLLPCNMPPPPSPQIQNTPPLRAICAGPTDPRFGQNNCFSNPCQFYTKCAKPKFVRKQYDYTVYTVCTQFVFYLMSTVYQGCSLSEQCS
jgi:hypothetical protein